MRYRLLSVKAQGGQGVICEAVDRVLERRVAIKLVRPGRMSQEDLLREAKSLASFAHPQVVTIHDAGIDDEHVFMVMDLVEGEQADIVALRSGFTPARARRIIAQVALGLHALHRAGFVHGDVSARNIVVDEDDNAKLIDLGLAAGGELATSGPRRLRGGTPGFVAPEVERDRVPSALGDQYALGRTLAVLLAACRRRSRTTEAVVRRATHPDPRQRYESMAALRTALRWSRARAVAPLAGLALVVGTLAVVPSDRVDGQPAEQASEYDREFSQAEDRFMEALRDGRIDEADHLLERIDDMAKRSGREELQARALVLSSRRSTDDAQSRSMLEQAIALAEAAQRPAVRAEALLLLSNLHEDPQAQKTLVELADSAASTEGEDFVAGALLAVARAAVGVADADVEAGTPTATMVDLNKAVNAIGTDDPAPEIDCDTLDGRYIRGLCWAAASATLLEQQPEVARDFAQRGLDLLEPLLDEDRCDIQLPLMVRGYTQLDTAPGSASRDLLEAATLCPEDPPSDNAELHLLAGYALALDGRLEAARVELAKSEPWLDQMDPDAREFYDRAQGIIEAAEG